jgi:hypothetical protein
MVEKMSCLNKKKTQENLKKKKKEIEKSNNLRQLHDI